MQPAFEGEFDDVVEEQDHVEGLKQEKSKSKSKSKNKNKTAEVKDYEAIETHNKTHDILRKLPKELIVKILLYLAPKDLTVVCQVNKRWKTIGADNYLWWKLCMEVFWEDSLRPTKMTNNDKKQSWKTHYMNVCVKNRAPIAEPEKLVKVWAEPVPPTKEEMREHYKSMRSKPKGKKPVHVVREFFDM